MSVITWPLLGPDGKVPASRLPDYATNSVRTDTDQGLSSAQQAQARVNIDAVARSGSELVAIGTNAAVSLPVNAPINWTGDQPDIVRSTVVLGIGALQNAFASNDVVAIGDNAGGAATPGAINILIGDRAGHNLSTDNVKGGNLTASRNVLVGSLSGLFGTDLQFCTGIGRDTLSSASQTDTLTSCTAVGYGSIVGGYNPTGLDGNIVTVDDLTEGYQTGVGTNALHYSNGGYNTAVGAAAAGQLSAGDQNAVLGAYALNQADVDLSADSKVVDTTGYSGTYSQSGTTITVTATGSAAVAGNLVRVKFTSGDAGNDLYTQQSIPFTVQTADGDSFTVVSPINQSASGDCTVTLVETTATRSPSARNVVVGSGAGNLMNSVIDSILIGYKVGQQNLGTTAPSGLLAIQQCKDGTLLPLVGGDLLNGRLGVNVKPGSELAGYRLRVMDPSATNRTELFSVNDAGTAAAAGGFTGQNLTIADDGVASLALPAGMKAAIVAVNGNTASVPTGLLWARVDSTPATTSLAMANNTTTTLTTGALTGTTGTDGNWTISANSDGKVYIENRSGSSRAITVTFLSVA